jgi:hypothetical protein
MLPSSITHEPQKQHSVNYRVIILLQHPYASTVSVMGRTASNRQQYVCVSETISRQPTDCIDRSIYAYSWSCNHKTHMVCRLPAGAGPCMHFIRWKDTRAGMSRRHASSYPRLKPCARTRRVVFATAPAMHTVYFLLSARTRSGRERERERAMHNAHACRTDCMVHCPPLGRQQIAVRRRRCTLPVV